MRGSRFALALIAVASAHARADAPAPTAAVPGPLPADAKDLAVLTDDAVLGKAARVNGDEAHGIVAFTFDDGPNPETTPAVIDALEKYDVPATFFIVTQRIVGKHGERGRELLAREVQDGFLIGSHSVTHPNLKNAQGDQIAKEIDASFKTLAPAVGRPIGLFRPPYGALSGAGRVRLKKLGVTEVIWSIDTLDWRAHDADRLRKKVGSMIEHDHGGIVLMHDVKPITAKVIAQVLDDLEAANCKKLAAGADPIIPVSLHYFLKDGDGKKAQARAIPVDVDKRTAAYKAALPERCAKRPKEEAPADESAAKPASAAKSDHPVGDFGKRVDHPKPTPEPAHSPCLDNPLAIGCR